MNIEDLPAEQREMLDELDPIALARFGPRTFGQLNKQERAVCAWEYFRQLLASFDPPADPGPMPAGWMQ